MKHQITQITIDFSDCQDEVNLPKVLRDWKSNGPMYVMPDGKNVRIPRSGHRVDFMNVMNNEETYVFTLTGFGKLDKSEALHLDDKAASAIKVFMGNAYGLLNISHKQEAERLIRKVGLDSFIRTLKKNYDPGNGRLAAFNDTVMGIREEEDKLDASDDNKVLSDAQLKQMGLM